MINYFCFFCYCCLNIGLFSQSFASYSLNHKYLKTVTPSLLTPHISDNNINTEDSGNSIDYGYFISGLWRGFHEVEELRVYYAYQFRTDNRFLARHRIYTNHKTVEDINLQGEWQFRDNTLEIKAVNSKDETQLFTIEFNLRNDFKLVYETGSLSDAYQMMVLNKIGRVVN